MWSPKFSLTAIACLIVTIFFASTYCNAQPPAEEVKSALDDLNRWLEAGEKYEDWGKYLKSDELKTQFGKGTEADVPTVVDILGQYAGDAPGLELPRFVRVRRALENWLGTLSPQVDQLPAACLAAKTTFVPVTEADVKRANAILASAVGLLDARLKAKGAVADGWRKYLEWDVVQAHLASEDAPDLAALNEIHARYASGHDGLGLAWFADVRHSLRRYLMAAQAVDNPELKTNYEALLDNLAGSLEAYGKNPTPDDAVAIGSALGWLNDTRQGRWLVPVIRHRLCYRNMFVQMSAKMVEASAARSVEETAPIEDNIMGTSIRGTGRMKGKVTVELAPSPRRAVIDNLFHGTIWTNSIGYNQSVRAYATGISRVAARKRVFIDDRRMWDLPTVSKATANTTINRIEASSSMVQRIAWQRATEQKAQAEQIAAGRMQDRVNRRLDEQSAESLAQSNRNYQRRFRKPLLDRRLFPQKLLFSTTKEALFIAALAASPAQLGSPTAPPPVDGKPDAAVRVHESMINNLTAGALAGNILTEKRFEQIITDLFGSVPERLQPEEDAEPWSIRFADQQPISVHFAEGGFTMTIRGSSYTSGDNGYPGMNVTATYKIEKTDEGPKAIRQGKLEIFPPGFEPGDGVKLSARQQVIRSLLERRFGKIFDEQMSADKLALPEGWETKGELSLAQWQSYSGWMVISWNLALESQAAK